jgi:hypothetical protein
MADVVPGRDIDAGGMTTHRTRIAVLILSVVLLLGSQSPAHAAGRTRELASGSWVSLVPVAVTSYQPSSADPLVGTFRGVGSTLWQGTFAGITEYTIGGQVDLLTGAGSGWIHERFSGRSSGGEVGTITFDERYTLDATGHIEIRAVVSSGTGDFADASGRLTFDGTSTSVASASGSYGGSWSRPA